MNVRELCLNSLNSVRNNFNDAANTEELFHRVQHIFPLNKDEYKIEYAQGVTEKFKAHVKCNISVNNVDSFIQQYNKQNNETLRISRTKRPSDNSPYSLVKYYRCHHNTRYEGTMNPPKVLAETPCKRIKNTNCEFSLVINFLKYDPHYTALLTIEWNHNHSVISLQSLGYKDIPPKVLEQVMTLFENGLLPGAAHKELMRQVKSECENEEQYHIKVADRSQIPRRSDFNNIYRDFKRMKFGSNDISEMFATLAKRIEDLKEKCCEYILEFQEYIDEINQPFILVIVTPLMRRVHEKVSDLLIFP